MSWDHVWIDINIATMNPSISGDYGAITQGAIAVKDGKIAWIGKQADLPQFDTLATPIYRGKGGWITPGLIDAHTHLVFAGSRANEFELRLKGASYEEIAKAGGGIISTVKACREASETELFELAKDRLNALAREGVTTVEIKSGYGLDTETELKLLRVAKKLDRYHHIDVQTTFWVPTLSRQNTKTSLMTMSISLSMRCCPQLLKKTSPMLWMSSVKISPLA